MPSDVSIYFGRGRNANVVRGAPQRSTLVLGPSRSGKTSSLIVPNLLMNGSAVVTTSTKDDVLRTMTGRPREGVTLLFDPSGTIEPPPGVTRVGYSPLRQSFSWDGAVLAARTLVTVARRRVDSAGDDHWTERASALVAPLLHAAALRHDALADLTMVVDERRGTDALTTLIDTYGDAHASVTSLRSVLATEAREQSSIWSTTSGLFAGMRTDAARRVATEPLIDLATFLTGPHHLHVVAPSRHQAVSVPLVVGLIDELVTATYALYPDGARLLLALDEVANVAPLPQLASIVSEGGGQGVVTLAALQDLSQARTRWGTHADGFVSLFPTTVVLPGIADRHTLELVSSLSGRTWTTRTTQQRGRRRHGSWSWDERARLRPADVAHGRPGHALVLDERREPRWVTLTPVHRDQRFNATTTARHPA